MNKPAHPLTPDQDIGPLDEHGQQIWSPAEEAAASRREADPTFIAAEAQAEADIAAGRVRSHEDHLIWMAERKREWFARRGL